MSGDVVMNFKIGLYTGNRPHDLVKAITIGIIPGAIISGIFAVIFSIGLGNHELNLAAPQAQVRDLAHLLLGPVVQAHQDFEAPLALPCLSRFQEKPELYPFVLSWRIPESNR